MQATTKEAYALLHEGTKALSQIEHNGIRVNVTYLEESINKINTEIATTEKELRDDVVFTKWRNKFGSKLTLGSSEQLGKLVFESLGFTSKQKTATGRYKTDAEALEEIDLPFVKKWLRWQQLKKMANTFLKGIYDELIGDRVHPFFHLHTVVTYRSSSSNPNFQNFPNRHLEFSKIIRQAFIPSKGNRLVEIDFKGAEVCISACYSKDENLIRYIKDTSTDMHRDTAADLFILPKEQVEKKTARDWAKNRFVFPEFYGSVYFQCARNIWKVAGSDKYFLMDGKTSFKEHLARHGITSLGDCVAGETPRAGTFEAHVKKVEEIFWGKRFKQYATWKDKFYNEYRRQGGFSTLTGFTVNGLYKRNEVTNAPIQGSAFHCLLWSLIRLQKWLRVSKMKTKIVGQIHDSIIADVPENEVQAYLSKAKEIITVDLPKVWKWIIVPLTTETEVSEIDGNWHAKTQWEDKKGVWQKTK